MQAVGCATLVEEDPTLVRQQGERSVQDRYTLNATNASKHPRHIAGAGAVLGPQG
jgi:hypothetical protein